MPLRAESISKAVAWSLAVAMLALVTMLVASGQLADRTQAGRRALPQTTVGEGVVSPTDLTLQHGRDLPEIVVEEPF